jgi:hypothetical protein
MKISYQKSKLKSLINIYLSMVLVLLFTFLTASTFAQQPDFSGTWKLNKQLSQTGDMPDSVLTGKIQVNQQNDRISIERFFIKTQGSTYKEELDFSGKSSEKIKIGDHFKTARLKWSDEKLIEDANVTGSLEGKDYNIHTSETWSLSADKKQLIIDRVLEGDEKVTNHLVYDKQ